MPAEHNIHGNGSQATDSFIKAGLCRVHIPSPLGKDLKRFTHLVNDIKNRRDDYASQLSRLTLAAMSSHSPESGDSQQEIISSLLSYGRPVPDKKKEPDNTEIWQARLVLAIAEILDYEEEDIARHLALLKDEEARLFMELHGDGENIEKGNPSEELSFIRKNLTPPSPGNMKKRFFSWKQLYNAGDVPPCDLLLTTSKDSADQIFESFEDKGNEPAVSYGRLSLPAFVGLNEEDAIQQIRSYQEHNMGLINTVTEKLHSLKTCTHPESALRSDSPFSSVSEAWEHSLETYFPAQFFGRIPLSFYCFAGVPCSTLLGADKKKSIGGNGLMVIADITSAGI